MIQFITKWNKIQQKNTFQYKQHEQNIRRQNTTNTTYQHKIIELITK